MKLYLVQHGEAAKKEIDPDRPLTGRGVEDIDRLAAFLGRAGVQVERVLHSGKRRAVQTAERLAGSVAAGVALETTGLVNPADNPKEFAWQNASWDKDMLVVSHLPFLAKLVSYLVGADEARSIVAFQPGTAVCLERSDDARWQINWMLRPELLV